MKRQILSALVLAATLGAISPAQALDFETSDFETFERRSSVQLINHSEPGHQVDLGKIFFKKALKKKEFKKEILKKKFFKKHYGDPHHPHYHGDFF